MHLTAAAPFNGASDQNFKLAVAYIVVFTHMFMASIGWQWISRDRMYPTRTCREHLKTKHNYLGAAIERVLISFRGLYFLRSSQAENSAYDGEKLVAPTHQLSDPPSLRDGATLETKRAQRTTEVAETKNEPAAPLFHRLARVGSSFLQTFAMPCSLSIIGSFIVSDIPVLKALFVPDVPGVNIPSSPDGQPPLAIILTTAFIGGASVPLGLMILGLAIARMEIPGGRLPSLPLGAVVALTLDDWIDQSGDLRHQRQSAAIHMYELHSSSAYGFLSCLPTAMTQVLLTQVYSGTGNAQHLSMFLIPQYILMFITMTVLTLHLLFG
ncbi:hypothetical protein OG21DRAFT_1523966 [Imleria badia]|nr:hypothetical protein OG21DRAFT_1523966 [Imleria badia]